MVAAIRGLRMAEAAKNLLFERANGIYAGDNCHRKWLNKTTTRGQISVRDYFSKESSIAQSLLQTRFATILAVLAVLDSSAPRRLLLRTSLLTSVLLSWVRWPQTTRNVMPNAFTKRRRDD